MEVAQTSPQERIFVDVLIPQLVEEIVEQVHHDDVQGVDCPMPQRGVREIVERRRQRNMRQFVD